MELEQMGLKVERTYIKKKKGEKKSTSKEIDDNTDNKDDDSKETEEDYSLICMYDIEKLTCDAVALSGEDLNITPPATSDADLIIPEESKATLSFDEILEGIVKCNKKNIPIQLQTSKDLLDLDQMDRFE
ncbi:hypothetical protein NQ314_017471 [Rhamnusium bicolor]|uniref:Uncharacterized protein n=1 Tax=Rhamnusium bicolor TaxID=1586634 RepID=A0AAV8WTS7_9CUCU|nr:hypothetical protein NQ314_017471 [Rhamnusium bicolor]